MLALRNDVYRRPLETALTRLGVGIGWKCVDVGAGGGDVSVALSQIVGDLGRVYALDSDPLSRDEVAMAAAKFDAQVIAITQAGEDLLLPEPVNLAYCRFLLMHVIDPAKVLSKMASAIGSGGWLVAQEPITSSGRVDGLPFTMPDARHPDIGAFLPKLVSDSGLTVTDAWAEAPASFGPGPIAQYLSHLTGADDLRGSIVLPPLVTVIAQK